MSATGSRNCPPRGPVPDHRRRADLHPRLRGGNTRHQTIALLNTRHPLFRDLYGPLALSEFAKDHDTARLLALTMLTAARAEAALERAAGRAAAATVRRT